MQCTISYWGCFISILQGAPGNFFFGDISWERGEGGVKVIIDLHRVPRFRIRGAVPPLAYATSWRRAYLKLDNFTLPLPLKIKSPVKLIIKSVNTQFSLSLSLPVSLVHNSPYTLHMPIKRDVSPQECNQLYHPSSHPKAEK